MSTRSRLLVFLGVFAAALVVVGAAVWAGRMLLSGGGVGQAALEAHPEAADPGEALIAVVGDASLSPQERTQAVWALGQMRDERALPVLEALYTGGPCDHEREICQYELGKAILKIKGEFRGGWQIIHTEK